MKRKLIEWLNRFGIYTSGQYIAALEEKSAAIQQAKQLENVVADIGNPLKPIVLSAPYSVIDNVSLSHGQQIIQLPSAHHVSILGVMCRSPESAPVAAPELWVFEYDNGATAWTRDPAEAQRIKRYLKEGETVTEYVRTKGGRA